MTARPHSRHLEELLPAFALGALDGEELRELTEHLTPELGTPAAHGAPAADLAPSGEGRSTDTASPPAEVACPICAAELRRLADDLEVIAMLEEREGVEGVEETET